LLTQPSRTATRTLALIAAIGAVSLSSAVAARADDAFGELGTEWTASLASPTDYGFAVDPTDNGVYVADVPTVADSGADGDYVVQLRKFNADGELLGTGTMPITFSDGTASLQVVGVTVDPSRGRVYVLTTALNSGTVDSAQQLYVFSTTPDGSQNLIAPSGLPSTLLADTSALDASGDNAIAAPTDLAVDPASGDVVVAGRVATGPNLGDVEFQPITAAGQMATPWVDTTGTFAGMPVAIAIGANSTAYVDWAPTNTVQVAKVNYTDTSATPQFFSTAGNTLTATGAPGPGVNVQFDPTASWSAQPAFGVSNGPLMALDPDGSKLWAFGGAAGAPSGHSGRAISTVDGSGLGFIGGQTDTTCTYPRSPGSGFAVGSGNVLFVLTRNGNVSRFGPTGTGCVEVADAGMTVDGNAVSGPIDAQKGQVMSFAANVTGANITSIDWDFGDGTTTPPTDQPVTSTGPSLAQTHTFTHGGTHTVTATIHTDSIVTPDPITDTMTVNVPASPVTASLSVTPSAPKVGDTVNFDASGTNDPDEIGDDTYTWDFGDGQTATTRTNTTTHTYASANTYSVSVRVSDPGTGNHDTATGSVTVKPADQNPPPTTTTDQTPPPTTTTDQTPPPATTSQTPPPPPNGPAVGFSGSSLTATSAGAVGLKLACPKSAKSCNGTLTLQTASAVSAAKKKAKKAILVLGKATFKLKPGKPATVTVHLSSKARALLKRSHSLRITAIVDARDGASTTRVVRHTFTLKLAAKKPAKKSRRH